MKNTEQELKSSKAEEAAAEVEEEPKAEEEVAEVEEEPKAEEEEELPKSKDSK